MARRQKANMTKSDTLPQAESRAAALSDSLLAWIAFDGTLADVHGGHDARSVTGEVEFGSDRAGKADKALSLSGTTGLTFSGVEIAGRSFTVQFWTLEPRQWILCQGIGEDFHGLHIGANDLGMRSDYWGSNQIAPDTSEGGWTHWVIRHDIKSGARTIWRNAVCVATMTSAPYLGSGDFTLGRHFKGAGFYSGSLDDLAIWDRALTDHDIATLFSGGDGLTYQNLTA